MLGKTEGKRRRGWQEMSWLDSIIDSVDMNLSKLRDEVAKSGTRLSGFPFIFTFMHRRRKWQPTPVFLPGESQGQGSLVGCRLWGCTESDTTEETQQQQQRW